MGSAFRVQRLPGRWSFVDAAGRAFVSAGVAHAEVTNLQYPHNLAIFRERYGSVQRWLREGVAADLTAWNFTTVSATEEYVSGSGLGTSGAAIDIGHSAGWPAEHYLATGMPYCVPVRALEIESWNGHPYYRDVRSPDFAAWCDYLARSICLPHADSDRLVGYVLTDGPSWIRHPTGDAFPGADDDEELEAIAETYYATLVGAIRQYDPEHLVLGDRFGTTAGLPDPVLRAAARHVDAISVQTFPGRDESLLERALERLDAVHALTGLPVLIVDTGNWAPTAMSPGRVSGIADQWERGVFYERTVRAFMERPWCLGWHWCGYVENPARGYGLKDPWDEPYTELTDRVTRVNAELLAQYGHGQPV
ncbi:agarase [Leifsonia sp. 22587]|uniref:agarase n=1 Tax=Leifsonia sp. 22587 TaxID=3453946 RepID=UPI003F8652C8